MTVTPGGTADPPVRRGCGYAAARDSCTRSANDCTVGAEKSAETGNETPSSFLTAAIRRTARRESPPSSKKLSKAESEDASKKPFHRESAATAALIGISGATPYWMLAVAVGIANFGIGVSTPAMTFALMESAGAEHANIASSMLNTNRQFGGLVGVAVIGIALANPGNWYAGAHTSFLITAACYGAAALLTLKYVSVAGRPRV
ncbi:hypothetical protein [Streptomyces griseofuscus]|uniref:hypothetical protein n=1 Tax=Streptomyces griseofuscus TaxID=146922 RepID=UPI003F4E4349